MVRIPEANRIEFLLDLEFPEVRDPKNRLEDGRVQLTKERAVQYRALKGELEALPETELQSRYNKAYRELQAKHDAETEAGRSFNLRSAKADHAYWSRMPLWTLEEAVALSLDRAPEVVKWSDVRGYVRSSPFAFQFSRRREMVERAAVARDLSFPIRPLDFVQWARAHDIGLPSALHAAPDPAEDWRAAHAAETEQQNATRAEMERLKAEIDNTSATKALSQRERSSCLKLIIGMAVKKYRYDPAAARGPAPSNIMNDLHELGIDIDVDTVRKWLKEAAEELPPSQTE
ncbi:hypothetical protein [Xanthobacter aminoxidans]|uniref:Uncharacterized protein n=1 Tax=Xanthobacter aminoxidans TaxID=186280 RepID=A0ABW6ZFQ9_9HYPH